MIPSSTPLASATPARSLALHRPPPRRGRPPFRRMAVLPPLPAAGWRRRSRAGTCRSHIGIIMDGNRRYARERSAAHVSFGHARGAEKLHQVLSWCYEAEIPVVTVWSFSLDNFHRDTREVEGLLQLFEDKTRELRRALRGAQERRPGALHRQDRPAAAEPAGGDPRRRGRPPPATIASTSTSPWPTAGARRSPTPSAASSPTEAEKGRSVAEVARGARREAHRAATSTPPACRSRTSSCAPAARCACRASCCGRAAYSEFYFCDTYWPAFRKIDFLRALRSHHQRQRRFGR